MAIEVISFELVLSQVIASKAIDRNMITSEIIGSEAILMKEFELK